jgi:hypothetical protein
VRPDITSDELRASKGSVVRATAKDDEIVIAAQPTQSDQVWIEKWIRDAIFFSDGAYAALKFHLKKSRFGMVRCLVDG